MKKTLLEITGEALVIYENLEENGGELTHNLEKELEINEAELQTKGKAYLEVIGENESYLERVDAEIKRLQALKKARKYLIENLKFRLLEAQKVFGDFEIGLHTITTRSSESIEVNNINFLPKEFKVVKVTESADKKALKEAIKRGEVIEGVTLKKNENLRIK